METKLNFRTKLTNCAERGGVKLLSILFLTMWMLFASKTNAQLYVGTNDTIYTNLDSTLTSSGANPPAVSYPTLTMNAYTPDESLTQFLNSKLNSYTIKSISLSDVYSLFNDSKYGQHFHFMLNNQDVIMHTQIHDLRSPIYTQSTQSQEGETIVVKENAGDIHNYSGVIENDNDADVRFNVYSDYVFGFIYKKEAKLFYYIETLNHLKLRYKITPNSGDENKLIIYMDYDSKVDNPQLASCTENGSGKTRLNKKIPEDPCAPYVVEFVVDADYSYYHNKFNNNYNDVKRALFDELNITESVYSSNFDIIFSINKFNVWTDANTDIYKNLTLAQDIQIAAKNYWTPTKVNRDVIFVSSAYWNPDVRGTSPVDIGNICVTDVDVAFMTFDIPNRIATICHEFGHLFNARHENATIGSGVDEDNPFASSIMKKGEYKSLWFNNTERDVIIEHITNHHDCLGDFVTTNTSNDWIKTYTNDNDVTKFSYWHWGIADYVRIIDIDGDGIEEVLTISQKNADWAMIQKWKCGSPNTWSYVWSNMGNHWIGSWKLNKGDRYFIGDFNGNGKKELLCISGGNSWAMIQEFNNNTWNFIWCNYGNGQINGRNIKKYDQYRIGKFLSSTKEQLLVLNTTNSDKKAEKFELDGSNNFNRIWNATTDFAGINFTDIDKSVTGKFDGTNTKLLTGYGDHASIVGFDINANNWVKQFTNPAAGSFAGWSLPFKNFDCLLSKDIDNNDSKDEMIFIQTDPNSYSNWAATIDLDNSANPQWNWSNSGNNQFGFWGLHGINNFTSIKQNPSFKAQIFAFNTRTNSSGFYGYSVGTFRASHYNRANYKKEISYPKMVDDKTLFTMNKIEFESKVKVAVQDKRLNVKVENINIPYMIKIFNLDGKIVSSSSINNTSVEISLDQCSQGIYLLNIQSSNFAKTLKIKL